jgi:NRPS condensation-like uncharacterized protein
MRYPITFVQESRLIVEEYMWNVGRQIDPFYISMALIIEGSLNIAALERAMNLMIERHGGLRAAFMQAGDMNPSERELAISNSINMPVLNSGLYAQYVADSAPLQIEVSFVETLDAEEQEIEIENLLRRSFARPFDYTRPPFIKAHLFRLSHDRHFLVLLLSHLICDMYGLQLFSKELAIIYDALAAL